MAICLAMLLLVGFQASAQDENSNGGSGRNADEVLNRGTLDLDAEMYLPDENGERVFVPNMTMQELLRLRNLASGQGSSYQFEAIRVQAKVREEAAEVSGDFAIRLSADSGPVEIPLRFGSVQIGLAQPEFSGKETFEYQFLADSAGYRWSLLPPSKGLGEASQHTARLRGMSPVTQESDRRRLRIELPQRPCEITISLPSNAVDERVRDEDYLEKQVTAEGVELKVRSRGGDFELTWRTQQAVRRLAAVEAQSQNTFAIGDPRDLWSVSSELTVRWFGSDAQESFRIRLPSNARWRSFPEDDFERFKIVAQMPEAESTIDDSESGESPMWDQDSAELLVTNLDPGQNRSIKLPLEWEWMPNIEQTGGPVSTEAPSLNISDVTLHRGIFNIVCPNSYLLIFREQAGVDLVQRSRLTDAFGSQQLQFKFDQQDAKLGLEFRREQSLPTVRPTYHVAVDKNKLVMTMWLDCSFDVNRLPHELGIIFGNWIPQDNTARMLDDANDLFSEQGELLRVEPQTDGSYLFSRAEAEVASYATSRRIRQVWRIVAERAWRPDENQLQFNVPSIIRGRDATPDHGSGVLIVSSTDQILLQWQQTPFRGLLPDSFSSDYQRFVSGEPTRRPLAYRFQSQGDIPAWAGQVELLPQSLTTSELITLRINESNVAIQQDFQLQIANVPLEQPRIAIHDKLIDVEPQFLVDGVLTTARKIQTISGLELRRLVGESPAEASENASFASDEVWNIYQIIGASPLQRSASVTLLTSLPWQNAFSDALDPDQPTYQDLEIPLGRFIADRSARRLERKLGVRSDYQVSLLRRASNSFINLRAEGEQEIELRPDEMAIGLRLQNSPYESGSPLVVDASWLQTAVTQSVRQDRFVARFSCTEAEIKLRLPAFASMRPAPVISLDGVELARPIYRTDEDVFVIPVSDRESRQHTLEVLYSVVSNLENWTAVDIAVPAIVGAELNGRFYWQLAIPRTQHLTWPPESLVPEWQWTWGPLFWHRKSSRTEQDLVQEFNAGEPRIPSSANTYLMSGQYPRQPYQVLVVARYLLWFPIGGLAILIATLVSNYRWFRRPIAGVLLAFLLAGVALTFPDLGVMLGQATGVALGLVLMVVATHAAVESRVRRRSVFTARSPSNLDGSERLTASQSAQGTAPTVTRKDSSIIAAGGKRD